MIEVFKNLPGFIQFLSALGGMFLAFLVLVGLVTVVRWIDRGSEF